MRSMCFFTLGVLSLTLTACSSSVFGSSLPFPTDLPAGEILEQNFLTLRHDLSPIKAYHFRIMIPNSWKTLDTKIEQEPAKDGVPLDVALFREDGDWMQSPTGLVKGEISISAVNVAGVTASPSDWLMQTLSKNAKGYKLLHKRESPSSSGPVANVLIRYANGDQVLVSRMMAFRTGDVMIIITGSDTEQGYVNNAEAFNVALSTFRLETAGKTTEKK